MKGYLGGWTLVIKSLTLVGDIQAAVYTPDCLTRALTSPW